MNPIEQVQAAVLAMLPDTIAEFDPPGDPATGRWFLDLTRDGHTVVVEWIPGRGIGVSLSSLDVGLGEGPEEVFLTHDVDAVTKRIVQLLQLAAPSHS
jgi:hypothetical protein